MSTPLQIGLVLFPKVTQLDFTGPLQVFSSVPGAKVHLIWKRIEPVPTDSVLTLTPTITFADCPQLDVICVPGGVGTDDMVNDEEMLAFLRKQAEAPSTSPRSARVRWCSARPACSKAIARRRTGPRWNFCRLRRDADQDARLRRSQPRHRRRRHRGHRFRADAGLAAASTAAPRKRSSSRLEYNPAPPFNAGSPDTAPPEVLAFMKDRIAQAPSHSAARRSRRAAAKLA